MNLFHTEIGFPSGFVAPKGRVELSWSGHANRARFDDRYGDIPAFKSATLDNLQIIEIGVEDGRVTKILYRAPIDSERDMCMVLIPKLRGPWTVKTVWVNLRTDAHRTLDKSKYSVP